MSFREPEGQVARWLEDLQSFNFTIAHRAGTQHCNADTLSRRPCAAEGCRYCEKREVREKELTQGNDASELTCTALQVVDAAGWRSQQIRDSDLEPVLQWLQRGRRTSCEEITGLSTATKGL